MPIQLPGKILSELHPGVPLDHHSLPQTKRKFQPSVSRKDARKNRRQDKKQRRKQFYTKKADDAPALSQMHPLSSLNVHKPIQSFAPISKPISGVRPTVSRTANDNTLPPVKIPEHPAETQDDKMMRMYAKKLRIKPSGKIGKAFMQDGLDFLLDVVDTPVRFFCHSPL